MAKITVYIKGITIQGNKWDMDSVVFEPPVRFSPNKPFEVENLTTITFTSTHSYMGNTFLNGVAKLIAKDGAPIIRVVSGTGSFIEGEMELVSKDGRMEVTTISKGKDVIPPSNFRRRIIK